MANGSRPLVEENVNKDLMWSEKKKRFRSYSMQFRRRRTDKVLYVPCRYEVYLGEDILFLCDSFRAMWQELYDTGRLSVGYNAFMGYRVKDENGLYRFHLLSNDNEVIRVKQKLHFADIYKKEQEMRRNNGGKMPVGSRVYPDWDEVIGSMLDF